MPKISTSWGPVATWYDDLLSAPGTYQQEVILPNLLRLVDPKPHDTILDLGCGQGFFAKQFAERGAKVTGVDISPELIKLAKKSAPKATFFTCSAEKLSPIADQSAHQAFSVLALQNIKDLSAVFKECSRVLKPNGHLSIVLNHPAFRIPKHSAWGWDDQTKTQYRRIDEYLSEITVPIDMHPGQNAKETTVSFHRPLQYYFKLLANSGFAITRLEEWISHKKNPPGARAAAENKARHEFPLFLYLEATKSLSS